jgi:endonuclease YncB( thermonuclease family)
MTAMRPQSGFSIRPGRLGPSARNLRAIARAVLGAIAVSPIMSHGAVTQAAAACGLEAIGIATVAAVRDGRTFILADGREARLAAIETSPADNARTALATLIAGRQVILKQASSTEDRYGRMQLFAYLAEDGLSVQETLLAAGLARVAARPGEPACAGLLLSRERAARTAGRGLWNKAGALLDASRPAEISAARGRFAVVQGTVLSVRESRGVLYINFGRRWTLGFTVIVLKRQERSFIRAGTDLRSLSGQRIRVRGWVEQRRGPVIEAALPEQIELVNATTASQQ